MARELQQEISIQQSSAVYESEAVVEWIYS